MARKVRSARGELVDFDLLKIKAQIASAPKPLTVQKREDFIDKRARRRIKKAKEAARTAIEASPVDVDAPKVGNDTE